MSKFILIFNHSSGQDEKEKLHDEIVAVLSKSQGQPEIIEFAPDNFQSKCEAAVKKAAEENKIVIAAGGDGTVNAVAALCYKYKVTMGIIPLGTFNYFARELNISTKAAEAAQTIIDGVEKQVAVGTVGERLFLNNASFGLYVKIITNREKDKSHFGRFKIVALFSAIVSLFKPQKSFSVKIKTDDKEEMRRTTMVFVGNNTLQLENLGLDVAACTNNNLLAVVIMKKISHWTTARMLLLSAVKNLSKADNLETFCTSNFEVESDRKNIKLALDGEIINCTTPLLFKVEAQALKVIVPINKENA